MASTNTPNGAQWSNNWKYSVPNIGDSLQGAIDNVLEVWGEQESVDQPSFCKRMLYAMEIAQKLLEVLDVEVGLVAIKAYLQPTSTTDFNFFIVVDAIDFISEKLANALDVVSAVEGENEDDVFMLLTTFHPFAHNTEDDVLGEGGYFEWKPPIAHQL